MYEMRSSIVTAHHGIDRDAKYAFRGQMFRDLLPKVGLRNLREAALFLGLSLRHVQRVAAGTHATSTAVGTLALMHDTQRSLAILTNAGRERAVPFQALPRRQHCVVSRDTTSFLNA
jgi:hypothetical protein